MPQSDFLSSLVINKVDTVNTLDAMDAAGLVNPNELYLVEEGDFSIVLDEQPTEGSRNLVTSGGIYQAIQNIPPPDVSDQINTHNTATDAHADIRQAISKKADLDETGKVPSDQLPSMDYAPSAHAGQHARGGSDPITPESIGAAPAYTYGTEDLIEGSSPLPIGTLYFVYE